LVKQSAVRFDKVKDKKRKKKKVIVNDEAPEKDVTEESEQAKLKL